MTNPHAKSSATAVAVAMRSLIALQSVLIRRLVARGALSEADVTEMLESVEQAIAETEPKGEQDQAEAEILRATVKNLRLALALSGKAAP